MSQEKLTAMGCEPGECEQAMKLDPSTLTWLVTTLEELGTKAKPALFAALPYLMKSPPDYLGALKAVLTTVLVPSA